MTETGCMKSTGRIPKPFGRAREGAKERGSQELLGAKLSSVRQMEQVSHDTQRAPGLYCKQEGSKKGN